MESQPQNPEFRNNPENFLPCTCIPVSILFQATIGPPKNAFQMVFHWQADGGPLSDVYSFGSFLESV